MNNNWKILFLTIGCALSAGSFGFDFGLRKGLGALTQREKAQGDEKSSYEKFDTKEISTRTVIDKNGRVVCESTETSSHNGEKTAPKVRRWTGTVDDLRNNRLTEEKTASEVQKPICGKQICRLPAVADKPVQNKKETAAAEPQNTVRKDIAYKAFRTFAKRVFDLAYNALIDLRQKEVEGCFAPEEEAVIDSFADVDDFMSRAFAEFFGTSEKPVQKKKAVCTVNGAKMFEDFISKVRAAAYQTMKEFGITPEGVRR